MKPTDEEIVSALLFHAESTRRGMSTSDIAKHFNLIGTYWIRKKLIEMQRMHKVSTCYPHGRNYCWTAYKVIL